MYSRALEQTKNCTELGGFDDHYMQLRVASIATPHHCMKLRIKSANSDYAPEHADQTDRVPEMADTANTAMLEAPPVCTGGADTAQCVVPNGNTVTKGNEVMDMQESQRDDRIISNQLVTPHPHGPKTTHTPTATPTVPSPIAPDNTTQGTLYIPVVVRCPCERAEIDSATLVTCSRCKYSQHSMCFGLETVAAALEHFCDQCVSAEDESETTSVARMYNQIDNAKTKCDTATRTVLLQSLRAHPTGKITDRAIQRATGFSKEVVQVQMQQLLIDGFVKARTRKGYPIMRRRVNSVTRLYYLQPEIATGSTVGAVLSPIGEHEHSEERAGESDVLINVNIEQPSQTQFFSPRKLRRPNKVKVESDGVIHTTPSGDQLTVPDLDPMRDINISNPVDEAPTVPETCGSGSKLARKSRARAETAQKLQSRTVSEFIDVDEMTALTREMVMNVSQMLPPNTSDRMDLNPTPQTKARQGGQTRDLATGNFGTTKKPPRAAGKLSRALVPATTSVKVPTTTSINAPVHAPAPRKRGRTVVREVVDGALQDITNIDSQDSWVSQSMERLPKRAKASVTAAHFTTVRH